MVDLQPVYIQSFLTQNENPRLLHLSVKCGIRCIECGPKLSHQNTKSQFSSLLNFNPKSVIRLNYQSSLKAVEGLEVMLLHSDSMLDLTTGTIDTQFDSSS